MITKSGGKRNGEYSAIIAFFLHLNINKTHFELFVSVTLGR